MIRKKDRNIFANLGMLETKLELGNVNSGEVFDKDEDEPGENGEGETSD